MYRSTVPPSVSQSAELPCLAQCIHFLAGAQGGVDVRILVVISCYHATYMHFSGQGSELRRNSVLVARPRRPVGKPRTAAAIVKLIFLQLLQKGKTVCNPNPGSLNRILLIKQVYKVLEHGRHYYSDGLRVLRYGGRVDVLINSKQGHESDSLLKAATFGLRSYS